MSIFTGRFFHNFTLWFIYWLDIIDSIVGILSFTFLHINFGMKARCKSAKFAMEKRIKEMKQNGGY